VICAQSFYIFGNSRFFHYFFVFKSARKFFYILTISLSYHYSRADFCLIPRWCSFNFFRKAPRISTFRLAAFFSRVYHRGPTFPRRCTLPSATISSPNIYEMRRPAPRRLSNVSEHSSSSMLKRHTRVSSTLSDVYVS